MTWMGAAVGWEWLTLAGALGLAVGSFLNVVIHRLPHMLDRQWAADAHDCLGLAQPSHPVPAGYGLAWPPSHCPHCQARVRWRHNLPVAGWILLRGRCADCGGAISVRYLWVELLAGLLFMACVWRFGPGLHAAAAMGCCAVLLALACIDLDHRLLPDVLTLPLLWAGLLVNAWGGLFAAPAAAISGAALGYSLLWGVSALFARLTGKVGMGHGDFKLLAALGAWFGWQAIPMLVLVSAVIGVAIGVFWRWRYQEAYAPFGPGLAAAGLLCLLGGVQ